MNNTSISDTDPKLKRRHKDKEKKKKSKNKKRDHSDKDRVKIKPEGKKKRRYDSSDSDGAEKKFRYDSSESESEDRVALPANQIYSSSIVPQMPSPVIVDLVIPKEVDTNADVSISAPYLESKKMSKLEFFASLKNSEDKKGVVGTVHARGKRDGDIAVSGGNAGDWSCPKCSTSNFKNSNQCQKCHALKRITQYR